MPRSLLRRAVDSITHVTQSSKLSGTCYVGTAHWCLSLSVKSVCRKSDLMSQLQPALLLAISLGFC